MASRRLAISSLLCNDETNPTSSSPTSPPTSARTSNAREFEPVDRLSRHHPVFLAQTSGAHSQTTPGYHPLSDPNYAPTVDRPRSYNNNDALRSRPTIYPPQLGYERQHSTSPERVPTHHQQQQIYTSPMPPYNTQSPPQPSPWSGHSPLYARPSVSASPDNHFPVTQSPVESRARSFSNSSTNLPQYPPQSNPTFPPFNMSPVSPQPPPSLSGGLEALAQAASQERRRLSNEFAESKRLTSRENTTRTPTVTQHPVASSSTYEHPTRDPTAAWRRRSKQHPEPPHKRRKSYDLLDEPIPAEPLEIFQPARPPTERSSLMRISALVPELPLPLDRNHVPPKPQRSTTLPHVSDVRHSVGAGPTIPIANLLTNDPPPRRVSTPPHPPPPAVRKVLISPPRSSISHPRSPSPYHSPGAQMLPTPNQPTIGHVLQKVRSPSPVTEEPPEGEVEGVHNVPTTPAQESSEPPTPSPVIPVEMHPSLSPASIQDKPPTPVRLASPVAEFEPEPVPTLEPPVPQLSTAVTEPERETVLEQAPEPAPVLVPPSEPDVEQEPATPSNFEPPRQISIISISTPLPPPAYSSPVLTIPGPGIRPPSPVLTSNYTQLRQPPTQTELEDDHDSEARNDEDGTESDNMTVDMEFDLAAGVAGDNAVGGGGGTRTDSEYDMEVDVEGELLRPADDNATHPRHSGDDNGHVGMSRYKTKVGGTSRPDAFFDHIVPPPMDLEKIMREQGQPRILYQQLQGPGQPLVPLIVHEPPPEPKPPAGGKKKQTTKAPVKPKHPAKPRAKGTKAKADGLQAQPITETVSYTGSGRMTKAPAVLSLPVTNLNSSAVGAAAARSRSQSTMPVAGENGDEKEAEKDEADDKVYCICRAEYEEGKVMIACDRCDEWYHMQCLGMSDLEVDLVDQFFCPSCIQNNPTILLKTTYKPRCFAGVKHQEPSSPTACHKPARGALSKYCSDECGVSFMQTRIEAWTVGRGLKAKLWETVKDADAREGVSTALSIPKRHTTVKAEVDADGDVKLDDVTLRNAKLESRIHVPAPTVKKGLSKQKERELERLRKELEKVVELRNSMKQELEIIEWRESLIKLASQRSEEVGECGWDQRLCMDDEEWAEVGPTILDNYDGQDQQDDESEPFVEWWCRGKKKCDRHAGWQRLRAAEVEFEIHQKELGLKKLADTERDIRRRIEDIMDPHLTTTQVQVNGKENKVKVNGTGKAGKKRKTAG